MGTGMRMKIGATPWGISTISLLLLLVLVICMSTHAGDIPRPVRDTAYDWRCLGPDGVASTHVRQDTAIWQCQTNAEANPGVTYYIQGGTYRVLVPVTVPACPQQPDTEVRSTVCLTGQTGSWQQSRLYASAPTPTCWTPGLWLPLDPPAGACVTPPPPPPPVPTLTGWLVDGWMYVGNAPPVIPITPPLVTRRDLQMIDYVDNPKYAPAIGDDYYVMRGRRLFDLPAGTYSITVASDDGVRVWAGSKMVVDMWLDQAATPKEYSFAHTGGVFEVRWEHYEAQWAASLRITNPVATTSPPPTSDTPPPTGAALVLDLVLPTENEDGTPVRPPLLVQVMYGAVIAPAIYARGKATVSPVPVGSYIAKARVTDAEGEVSVWSANVSASTILLPLLTYW